MHTYMHARTHARAHTHTHSLTHSHTHSHTHSLTHLLTHLLTHSLTLCLCGQTADSCNIEQVIVQVWDILYCLSRMLKKIVKEKGYICRINTEN
jgi:hypothetical protein